MSGFSCQSSMVTHIFRNVLNPARIEPPIHVLYFRSGGAKILIFISLTASRRTSLRSRSPKPLVRVDPPDMTMLPNNDFLRSISVRLIASTTIWCTPGYSSPMISGSNRISGALNLSVPSCCISCQHTHQPR
jgi:hypothetical protein